MKTLAVANQKGGVGKSTLTVHLAYAAAEAGLRVLLVDMDKQGSLSLSFPALNGAVPGLQASSLYDTEPNGTAPEYIGEHVAIIRADERLALLDGAEDNFIKRPAQHLRRFADDFDLCLIDTPGLIGMKLYAALAAADAVICPVSVGLFESAGLAELWKFIKAVKTKGYNPRLRLMGMIPSKVNTRSPEEREGLLALRAQFGPAILPEMLAERAAVKQAISRRRPVWVNTKGAGHLTAAKEWKAACKSILVNLGSITK
jgi:chromosome partitioning protein